MCLSVQVLWELITMKVPWGDMNAFQVGLRLCLFPLAGSSCPPCRRASSDELYHADLA